MKLVTGLIILLFLNNCSFDSKSGIWKNEKQISSKKSDITENFETFESAKEKFNKIIIFNNNYSFKTSDLITNDRWLDIFFSDENNLKNFSYKSLNQPIFKSRKLTKFETSEYLLFEKNKIIISDKKGNIVVFSISENKVIFKFNFYKKKYKKINKILNLSIENNVIYISDNLGFIYALDYVSEKILWAKNYKIPFRSNIKISNNNVIMANQNNSILFIDKKNGEILKTIPTEENVFIGDFINNFAVHKNNVLFLNTFGSLYSLNSKTLDINWFLNLNDTLDINPSKIFRSNQLIVSKNKIFVPANDNLYVIDLLTGSIIFKKNFTSILKPLVINNVLFSIDNDLLIATELESGKILYSYDINKKIAEFLDTKKKRVKLKSIISADNKIFVFLNNSFVIKFNFNGEISEISKLPEKINSMPIIVENQLIYLNNKNRISIIN
jgi:outer membrane protein assembly factor BamB